MASTTTTTAAVFIPEKWIDETRDELKEKLVIVPTVKSFPHEGQPGDILHVPNVSNLVANDMNESGEVVAQAVTESEFTLTINEWKESSVLIRDLAAVQSQYSLRREYTREMAHAIARTMEVDLANLMAATSNSFDADATAASSSGGVITVAGILKGKETLDQNDVSLMDRTFLIAPAQLADVLQINAFTSSDFANVKSVVSGMVGQIFGMNVIVSTVIGQAAQSDSNNKINAYVYHRDAESIAIQRSPRVQAQYLLPKLGWLITTDVTYGVKEFRDTNIVRLITTDTG